jgi:SNF2 family DNA or RNA helicase
VRPFAPRPWQEPMIDFGLKHERCMLLARMGMGKTSAVLAVTDALLMAGSIRRNLVIAPLRVARSTWPEEIAKWEQFAHLKVQPIVGTLDERKAALRNDKADIYTVNYDVVPWLIDTIGVDNWPFDMVTPDEATRIKSFRLLQGGKRAQALSAIAHKKTRRWLNLTGTFVPNGMADIWGPMWFIDEGQRLGRTYDSFESRWFGYQRAKDAVTAHKTRIKRVTFPHAQGEILGLIKDVSLALNPKDWFPIKQPIVVPVYVDLPAEAKKKYREMERDMFVHLKGYDIEAFASSGKVIKCLQLANGAIYTGSDEQVERDVSHWVEAHDEKLQALESIIEEAQGEPVMVAYHFKPDLARLKKRFPEGRHINTKRDEDDFKAGLIPVAFVHAQSIGHGVDGFQNVCHIIVFFALWWDYETHSQLIERIGPMRQMQAGLDREVMIYLILARGTVDETVAERLDTKRDVMDETMDTLAYKEVLW